MVRWVRNSSVGRASSRAATLRGVPSLQLWLRAGLKSQKNLLPIQPPDQAKPDANLAQGQQQVAATRRDVPVQPCLHVSAQKPRGDLAKADDVVRQVDRDGIHPVPNKGLTPTAPLADLDHPVKHPQ